MSRGQPRTVHPVPSVPLLDELDELGVGEDARPRSERGPTEEPDVPLPDVLLDPVPE